MDHQHHPAGLLYMLDHKGFLARLGVAADDAGTCGGFHRGKLADHAALTPTTDTNRLRRVRPPGMSGDSVFVSAGPVEGGSETVVEFFCGDGVRSSMASTKSPGVTAIGVCMSVLKQQHAASLGRARML